MTSRATEDSKRSGPRNPLHALGRSTYLATLIASVFAAAFSTADCPAQYPTLALDLPKRAVPNRVSKTDNIPAGTRKTYAELEGPGCIRHIWATHSRNDNDNRNVIIRIYFDGEPVPYVEAPLGDFFGVMHGKAWYPINTPFLSVQAKSGYNCYFEMPFAKSARVEFEAGPRSQVIYCQVDWHQYPEEELKEQRRFCARWRREFPTERYGEDFFMLDAAGPGRLLGFVYGVRLIDNVDRWSHGGADNIFIDGDGKHPAYLRGIGGEDTFGTSYGGSLHTPRTHLNAEMAYYEQVDDGAARPAKEITGYRWFINDFVEFEKSIHMRFGCMSNDICATVYWYQQQPVRPFFRIPDFAFLVPGRDSKEIKRGTLDLPLPDAGRWLVSPAGDLNIVEAAASGPLKADADFAPKGWTNRPAMHGFVNFSYVHRPQVRGVGTHHVGAASARCVLDAPAEMKARMRLAWDDRLVLRVNDGSPIDLGERKNFGSREIEVPLKKGRNRVEVTLSNSRNFNHGGWAFAFQAVTPDGKTLLPAVP